MEGLISQIKALPPLKQKLATAVVAALVADAAAQPVHWVYDDDVMAAATKGGNPEFLVEAANPFYRLPAGSQSFYGDQTIVLLKSLAQSKGLDLKNYAETYMKTFGPGSSYDVQEGSYPVQGPWRSSPIKRFVFELYPNGKTAKDLDKDDSDDPSCSMLSLPIALRYFGSPDEFKRNQVDAYNMLVTSEVSRIALAIFTELMDMYTNNEADGNGEKILEKLADRLKDHPDKNVSGFSHSIHEVLASKSLSIVEITDKFGKPWGLPDSLQSALGGLLRETGFMETVRQVILGGGCNCSRLGLVAACLGIKYGIDGIPREWMTKTLRIEEILQVVLEVAKQ